MPEQAESQNHVVEVRVICLLDDESEISEEDQNLPDTVEVEVDGDIESKWIANAALDAFHSSCAVECLDDFRFEVWMGGEEIEEDDSEDAPDSYSLADKARVL